MIGILATTGKKTFSLCVLAGLTATLATFSQDVDKPTNSLPTEREISDASGKKSHGTVLEINRAAIEYKYLQGNQHPRTMLTSRLNAADKARVENAATLPIPITLGKETVEATRKIEESITFRRSSDQQEFTIPLSKLSAADRTWAASLPIRWKRPTGIRGEKKPPELETESWAVNREMVGMSTADIQRMIKTHDYKMETWLAEMEWSAMNSKNRSEYRYQSPIPLILAINPGSADETVSLRKEFEKAGIRSIAQTPNACALYSGYSLYQYLIWKKGGQPITLDQLKTAAQSFGPKWSADQIAKDPGLNERFSRNSIIKAGLKLRGIHPAYTVLTSPVNMRVDLIKHCLKTGSPIWIDIHSNTNQAHALLLTGFQTSNGKTRFEVLDSNGPESGDGGYRWIEAWEVIQAYLLTTE